ncbi:hypothetical protein ZOSMA_317G00120 [Zostera marina]|uniref:Uncharacterized protein n=1 Tax=Zostera marina TaxID=29655 RepID=A0A0K9P9G7_ZOSMR|nr:hypothetical protein ZOSMA_317G00120 [Zostera marina]
MGSVPALLRSRVSCARFVVSSFLNTSKKSTPVPSKTRGVPSITRSTSTAEVRCLVTMMPLHSATASALLISALSPESQIWGRVLSGLSMPL